jgi:hypothetical protein
MKRRAPACNRAALSAEIAGLPKAGFKELRERWTALYGKEPSAHIGRSFMMGAIAYRLQERAFGGLKPSIRRLLARVAKETAAGSSPKNLPVRKAENWNDPGTRMAGERAPGTRMAGERASGHSARRGSVVQRETLPFAFGSCARDHRQSLVRTAILRAPSTGDGEQPCNALRPLPDVARSTLANLPRKD